MQARNSGPIFKMMMMMTTMMLLSSWCFFAQNTLRSMQGNTLITEKKERKKNTKFRKPQTQIYRMTDEHKLCIRRHNYRGFVTVILPKHRKKSSNKKKITHTPVETLIF